MDFDLLRTGTPRAMLDQTIATRVFRELLWSYDRGKADRTQAALCKLYCVRSAFEVVDDAMQIFGGIGYTKDLRIHRLWTSTRFFRIAGETDEIMYYIAGPQLLKTTK